MAGGNQGLSSGLIPYVMCGRLGAKGVKPLGVACAELAQWGRPWCSYRTLLGCGERTVAMTENFCSGTSQIRSAHWINPPWGVFPRLGWSVAPFVRPQQRPRAEPGERRAELLRRALPCLASLPLDPPSQTHWPWPGAPGTPCRGRVLAALRSVSVIKTLQKL